MSANDGTAGEVNVNDISTGEIDKNGAKKRQFNVSYVIIPALVSLFIIAYEDFLNNVVIQPFMYILKTAGILTLEKGTNEYILFILLLNLILNFASLILIYFMFFKSGLLAKQIENKQYGLTTTVKTYLALFALVIGVGIIFTLIKNLYFPSVPTTSPYSAIFPTSPDYSYFNLIIVILLVCIFAPILEELIFRRILIPLLEGTLFISTPYAIVVSATVFAFIHSESDLLNGSIYFAIVHFTSACILGLGLAAIYTTTRNVKYSIFYHSLNNTISMITTIISAYFITDTSTTNPSNIVVIYGFFTFGLIIAGAIMLIIALLRTDKIKHPLINQFKSSITLDQMTLALLSILVIQGIIFIIIPYFEIILFDKFISDNLTIVIINALIYTVIFLFFVFVIRSNLSSLFEWGTVQNSPVPQYVEKRYTYYQGAQPYPYQQYQGYQPNTQNQPGYNPNQNQPGYYPNQDQAVNNPSQAYNNYAQGFPSQNQPNPQTQKISCPNCGNSIPANDIKFCPYCGHNLTQ